ncbi:MAG: hypothetical protein ACRERU_21420 [Methylococcales bacterium]
MQDFRRRGFGETLDDRLDWGQMRMEPTDLADVTGATYHFLINGQTPAMNWTALFCRGDQVRLRFVNASAMTYFDVRIPGLTMRVIEADGQPVMPVEVEQFRIAVAETYDVLVEPEADRAYRIFAETMDRSGFAAATLTSRGGLKADSPQTSPRTLLTMADMGSMHGGHRDATLGGAAVNHSEPMNHPTHAEHKEHAAALPSADTAQEYSHADPIQHKPATDTATHRALSYQDLMVISPNRESQTTGREITLRLTGNMNRYIWSFDAIKYSASPVTTTQNEKASDQN